MYDFLVKSNNYLSLSYQNAISIIDVWRSLYSLGFEQISTESMWLTPIIVLSCWLHSTHCNVYIFRVYCGISMRVCAWHVHTCDIKVNSSLRSQLSLTLNIIMMLRKGVEGRNINSVHSLCVWETLKKKRHWVTNKLKGEYCGEDLVVWSSNIVWC